jgi:HEPN domain-containing protein
VTSPLPEWLSRLGAAEWIAAAENELRQAHAQLAARRHREGLTYARRAAGMALNARLTRDFDESYGRSYMDHLHALAADARAPEPVRNAAATLIGTPIRPELVTLGAPELGLALAAATIVDWVRA